MIISNNSLYNGSSDCKAETPNVKKRHRRIKSSGVKNQEVDGETSTNIVKHKHNHSNTLHEITHNSK